jgi:hypothetical protein
MVLNGECTICKEIREGSKYRKVSEDSKIKAETGGYNNLSIGDLICNICYNRYINFDSYSKRNTKSKNESFTTKVQSSSSNTLKVVELEKQIEELQQYVTELSIELENKTRPVDTNNLIGYYSYYKKNIVNIKL